ncbi:MAG: HEAT repeat domain-containing protein [Planctomycetota bacterium]|jgi:hypothetical protein
MRNGEVSGDRARTAGWARSCSAVALAVVCLATATRARDVIHLRDGQFLEGTVTRETDEAVWLTVRNSTVRINRSRVKRIERDKPLPSWEARFRAKLREDRERRAAAALAAAEKTRAEKKTAASKKDEERAARLVADLASDDPDARREAVALLEREGAKAIPALTKGLTHANTFARESSARLLGRLGARQSVREMIIALRSAVPEKDKIRPWQRSFVRALRVSLQHTTGQDFGVSLYGTHQGKAVEKYVEWWDGEAPGGGKAGGPGPSKGACIGWDTPQVGEEQIAEDDPEREKKLWDARRIGNERRTYSAPKSFTDPFGEATGGE